MTDYELSYKIDDLRQQEMELRENLYMWATMKPPATGTPTSKMVNALGVEITYLQMGKELRRRLDTILDLQRAHDNDIMRAEHDRAHLSEHQEEGKPLEQWELELMGLRKVADIKYEVICHACADADNPAEYFGKKLEWLPSNGTELVTQMHLDFAIQARDSHLDNHPDHTVNLDLV